jgi:hypothetical protein
VAGLQQPNPRERTVMPRVFLSAPLDGISVATKYRNRHEIPDAGIARSGWVLIPGADPRTLRLIRNLEDPARCD